MANITLSFAEKIIKERERVYHAVKSAIRLYLSNPEIDKPEIQQLLLDVGKATNAINKMIDFHALADSSNKLTELKFNQPTLEDKVYSQAEAVLFFHQILGIRKETKHESVYTLLFKALREKIIPTSDDAEEEILSRKL